MESQCRSSDLVAAGTAIATASSILSQFTEWQEVADSLSAVAQKLFEKIPGEELMKISHEKDEILRRIQC